MATFPQKPGAGAAAPAVPKGWRELWSVDWTAESSHDFLTEGSYTDAAGTSWDIADNTINGESSASALEIQNGTGLVITTSADGEVSLAQELSTLYPGIGREDRVAIVVDLDSSVFVQNFQYVKWAVGTRTWGTHTHTLLVGYSNAIYHGAFLRDGGGSVGSNINGTIYDALGLDFSDQQTRTYGKSSYAAPFTGWSSVRRLAWNSNPSTADASRPTAADAWAQLAVNRNGGANLTLTVRRMAMYGWVPDWAGD